MNYAYNPQSYSGFSTAPFSSWLQGLAPTQRQMVESQFMLNPDLALQQLIDTTRPSNQNEELLRRMLPILRDRWSTKQLTSDNPLGMGSFTDFLTSTNFNQEFARINPEARKERPNNFMRPVRTITF
jgi:hypothetical protein